MLFIVELARNGDQEKLMPKITCPSEQREQITLIQWRDYWVENHPKLSLLYSIPNGGYRAKRTAVVMKATGTKKGVPDLHLPIPAQGCHALFIELKRVKGGSLSPEQKQVIAQLKEHGNKVEVCKGCLEAIAVINDYLDIDCPLPIHIAAFL
jgi:hypothetical protein